MGIDNVALKTFNSTGAQSVCRANEADSSKLIESQFLTKCTTEYINGSGMSVISGKQNFTLSANTTTNETFYLPNDTDAISDIVYTGVPLDYIQTIVIKIGNLTVQTIYHGDILSRNATELGVNITTPTFSIPFIGRSKGVKNSFLQAGAITNAMTLTFTYKTDSNGTPYSSSICVFSHQITKTEKDFISKNIINRIVNTSQNCSQAVTTSDTNSVINLSSININVSHILILVPTGVTLTSAELVLGNDRTGVIDADLIKIGNSADLFSLFAPNITGYTLYIIKTAETAFSTAGIPFSRVNNKSLNLVYGNITQNGTINITACGTQVQTTVGGSTSFSA